MAYESGADDKKAPPSDADILRQLITDATHYIDHEVSPERAKATDYYFGRPFGNEQEGRSKVILTEVRDSIHQTIPSVMRLAHGPEHVCEFVPEGPQAVDKAREATEYIRYVYEQENGGFTRSLDVLQDGLVRKIGIFKWGWDSASKTSHHKLTGITQEQLLLLAEDEEIELTKVVETEPGIHDVEFKRDDEAGCARVWTVPPEEFFYNRKARSLDDAIIVGHRMRKTRSDLIALGIDPEVIDEHGGHDPNLEDNEEVIARNPLGDVQGEEQTTEEAEGILYVESWTRAFDTDGDGVAELRRICTIGPGYHEVENEPVDEVPFALFCPFPEPHTITGQSQADLTMDLQFTKSMVLRALLDSAAASIFPRTAAKEGDANIQDVLNTEIGAPIRTRGRPGEALMPITHPFIGKELLPVLGYFDEIKESRVGRAGGAGGLHMDSMQSSTKSAVTAAVQDAQMRTEMVARLFAETLKRVFAGLLRLYVQHQPTAKMVKLGQEWKSIDPRSWNAEMDVKINVMLGAGLTEEKLAMLEAIIAKQEMYMGMLGPNNPLVGFVELRNAIDDAVALRGRQDVERYFKPFTKEQEKAMAQAAQQAEGEPKAETPEQIIAQAQIQIEQMKAQRELTVKEAELRLKQEEMASKLQMEREKMAMEQEREMYRIQLEDDRQRDKQAADMALKREEIEAKYQAQVTAAELKAEADAARATSQAGPSGE